MAVGMRVEGRGVGSAEGRGVGAMVVGMLVAPVFEGENVGLVVGRLVIPLVEGPAVGSAEGATLGPLGAGVGSLVGGLTPGSTVPKQLVVVLSHLLLDRT